MTQCVILRPELRLCDGRPLLFWLLREFVRYGVSEFLLPVDSATQQPAVAAIQASLPRPVRVTFAPRTTMLAAIRRAAPSDMPAPAAPPDTAAPVAPPDMSAPAVPPDPDAPAAPPNIAAPGAPSDMSAPAAPPDMAAVLSGERPLLHDRFLLCAGDVLFDEHLGALLARGAVGQAAGGKVVLLHRTAMHLPGDAAAMLAAQESQAGQGGPALSSAAAQPCQGVPVRGAPLRRRALFLDRDGVINLDHGYVGSRERFEWVDGALDAIRWASEAGWHVFIVTNQSGVARGLFDEAAVRDLLDWIVAQARAAGGTIDDVRYCPFHPDGLVERYRQSHAWRKPLPGMLLDLIETWDLDAGRAVMVGDQATDMAAAAAAGVPGFLFPGGNLLGFLRPILAA